MWNGCCFSSILGQAKSRLARVMLQLEGRSLDRQCSLASSLYEGIVVAFALRSWSHCGGWRGIIARLSPSDDVRQPVSQPSGRRVNGGMRAVDADTVAGKAQKRLLLGVGKGEGLQPAEDDGVVCNNDRRFKSDGFVGNCFGQVDGQQHCVCLTTSRIERGFQQQPSVVPGVVREFFRVAMQVLLCRVFVHGAPEATYSFCIALTTAFEKGAELVLALIVAAKERLRVVKNMQSAPNVACTQLRVVGYR